MNQEESLPPKHRKHMRLTGYDYSQAGMYFVTICTHQRAQLFGAIRNGEMVLNAQGTIAREEWQRTASLRTNVEIDLFVVMPNHTHAIISILDIQNIYSTHGRDLVHQIPTPQFSKPTAGSLGTIVGAYKASVSRQINRLFHPPQSPIWQYNYYDHIIRSETDLNTIREYILTNPARWEEDSLYEYE